MYQMPWMIWQSLSTWCHTTPPNLHRSLNDLAASVGAALPQHPSQKVVAPLRHLTFDESVTQEIETELFVGTWVHDDHWTAAEKVLPSRD